ncbi:WXG100 family type VII secretion target [Nocardia sp. NPDC001965]
MSSLPPTKTQIRQWDTASLGQQGQEWTQAAQTTLTEHGAVSRQLADSPGFWRGDAADAMRVKGEETRTSLSSVVTALEQAGTVATQAGPSLLAAKTTAVNAIDTAEKERFVVGEQGDVGYTKELLAWVQAELGTMSWQIAHSVLYKQAQKHEDVIKPALRAAADAAETVRNALDKAFENVKLPPGWELEAIVTEYQAQADPGGMVTWPEEGLLGLIAGPTGKAKEVTAAEAEMLDNLSMGDKIRFYRIMTEAEDTANGMFEGDLEQDDQTDAFRHAYWNALMTREFGEDWTKEYTFKHEGRPDNASVREAMDLYNNEIGRTIALQNPDASPEELQDLVKEAVGRGDTVVINQERQLSWSDDVPIGQTVDSSDLDSRPKFLPGSPVPDDSPSPK